MEAFLVSTGVVALAEVGDKTQLLALVLAARHRKPWPIIAGILLATLANHALAGALGTWLTDLVGAGAMRWLVGLSFVGMALWMLVPDREPDQPMGASRFTGVFLTTLVAFFLVEIGDKTQIATVALAARFDALAAVVLGTTLGMLLANAPVVLAGDAVTRRLPLAAIRVACALTFVALGLYALFGL
jgi:putative Ca2+/H+ antiporter (TMEM165/GDT1 family)